MPAPRMLDADHSYLLRKAPPACISPPMARRTTETFNDIGKARQ